MHRCCTVPTLYEISRVPLLYAVDFEILKCAADYVPLLYVPTFVTAAFLSIQ